MATLKQQIAPLPAPLEEIASLMRAARYRAALDAARRVREPAARLLEAQIQLRLSASAEALFELRELETSDENEHLHANAMIAEAHARLGDFAASDAAASQISDLQLRVAPKWLQCEVALRRAAIAWMRNDVTAARTLVDVAIESPLPEGKAKALIMRSWVAAQIEDYGEQLRDLSLAAETLCAAAQIDIGVLANATRTISVLAKDLRVPSALDLAAQLVGAIQWTDDLTQDHFESRRNLGWGLALQGRYFEAIYQLQKATDIAPSPELRVRSMLDRAYIRRAAGERDSSRADLDQAIERAAPIDWSKASVEEHVALLIAAELVAEHDPHAARSYLDRFKTLQPILDPMVGLSHDRRLAAFHAYAAAVVAEALGEDPQNMLKAAFIVFDEIGFRWRATLAALRLFRITGERAWLEFAQSRGADYRKCWIGTLLSEAEVEGLDDALGDLTPMQRRIFKFLLEGWNAAKIAQKLGRAQSTVKNHIQWIYHAFGVNTQAELLAEARRRLLA